MHIKFKTPKLDPRQQRLLREYYLRVVSPWLSRTSRKTKLKRALQFGIPVNLLTMSERWLPTVRQALKLAAMMPRHTWPPDIAAEIGGVRAICEDYRAHLDPKWLEAQLRKVRKSGPGVTQYKYVQGPYKGRTAAAARLLAAQCGSVRAAARRLRCPYMRFYQICRGEIGASHELARRIHAEAGTGEQIGGTNNDS